MLMAKKFWIPKMRITPTVRFKRFWRLALTKVDLKSVENLLLLGMGGGSIIKSLRETFKYQSNIAAVEIDPAIIKLAKEEFGITTTENLQIIEGDAFQFVKNSKEKFQLIIIDLFIDTNVPAIFYGKEFSKYISTILQKNGALLFNVGVNLKKESVTVETLISHFGSSFKFQILQKVNGTNTLLIGEKLEQ